MYTELLNPDSIRLLTIHPGGFGSPLETSLHEVRLSDAPEYDCLSYTWGIYLHNESIKVNHTQLDITRGLWHFLQRIRLPDRTRVIWVDAICVSQDDLSEKAQQVSMIGDIFKSASKVLVWLGEHADGSEFIFHPGRDVFGMARMVLGSNPPDKRYRAWKILLMRPYFSRVWVIQEIALAKVLLVHCGDDVSEWEPLFEDRVNITWLDGVHRAFDGVKYVSSSFRKTLPRAEFEKFDKLVTKLDDLIRVRKFYRREAGLEAERSNAPRLANTTSQTIWSFSSSERFDRRDRVYALLSLETDHEIRKAISVSYEVDVTELAAITLEALRPVKWYKDGRAGTLIQHLRLTKNEMMEVADIMIDRTGDLSDAQRDALDRILGMELDLGVKNHFRAQDIEPDESQREDFLKWRNFARVEGKWPEPG